MSLSLLRRAILAQSVGASLPLDVLSVRSAIAAASGGVRETRNEQMGSFAAGASLTQRVPASTAASAGIPPSKTYRTGTLAVKVGMTQGACPQGFTRRSSFALVTRPPLALPSFAATGSSSSHARPRPPPEFDHHGQRIPLSILWLDDVQVTQIKPYSATSSSLQLGIGSKRRKQIPATLAGHFDAAGVPYKRKTKEFRVTNDAILPVGHTITAAHFVPGQYVDVSGTSIGKGFQGVMKRWGFAGQPASHGNSLAHRKGGSTGQCQDPGKVFKGKKMAGRMGGARATTMGCLVWRVDVDRGLVYVKGQVPGHKGNFVEVRDSQKTGGAVNDGVTLPVPTGELVSGVFVAGKPAQNPFDVTR